MEYFSRMPQIIDFIHKFWYSYIIKSLIKYITIKYILLSLFIFLFVLYCSILYINSKNDKYTKCKHLEHLKYATNLYSALKKLKLKCCTYITFADMQKQIFNKFFMFLIYLLLNKYKCLPIHF